MLLGFGFALCGRERIRIDGPFGPPAFRLVLIFAGVILVPMALYLYLAHPAWTWLYMVEPSTVPSLIFLPLLVGHGASLIGGWYIGARLVRAKRTRHAIYVLAGAIVTLTIAVGILWGRIGKYGTVEEFRAGRAVGLMEVKLGYVLIAMVLGVTCAAIVVGLQLVRDSRRATSR